MTAKYYLENSETLQRKEAESYQNLSEEEKSNQRNYVHNQYNKLFTENELSEEKENAKIEYPLNL